MCEASHMATNIELDETLLKKAMKLGKTKTKKETVQRALEEYVRHREQLEVLSLFNSITPDALISEHDYKSQRKVS